MVNSGKIWTKGGDYMYKVDRIINSYKESVNNIKDINRAIQDICNEAKVKEELDITYSEGQLNVIANYDNNKLGINIAYNEIINRICEFNRYYPREQQNVNFSDKLIIIIENKLAEQATSLAETIK